MIDQAIFSAISAKKPVYLEIPCNLSKFEVPEPTPFNFAYKPTSDPGALKTATMDIQAYIAASVKPVLIGGVHLRSAESRVEFTAFANKLQCGVALMPDAKSLFSESHPLYVSYRITSFAIITDIA